MMSEITCSSFITWHRNSTDFDNCSTFFQSHNASEKPDLSIKKQWDRKLDKIIIILHDNGTLNMLIRETTGSRDRLGVWWKRPFPEATASRQYRTMVQTQWFHSLYVESNVPRCIDSEITSLIASELSHEEQRNTMWPTRHGLMAFDKATLLNLTRLSSGQYLSG